MWLRGKLEGHTKETFHRADSQLLYSAATDILRALDESREENKLLREVAIEFGAEEWFVIPTQEHVEEALQSLRESAPE